MWAMGAMPEKPSRSGSSRRKRHRPEQVDELLDRYVRVGEQRDLEVTVDQIDLLEDVGTVRGEHRRRLSSDLDGVAAGPLGRERHLVVRVEGLVTGLVGHLDVSEHEERLAVAQPPPVGHAPSGKEYLRAG